MVSIIILRRDEKLEDIQRKHLTQTDLVLRRSGDDASFDILSSRVVTTRTSLRTLDGTARLLERLEDEPAEGAVE